MRTSGRRWLSGAKGRQLPRALVIFLVLLVLILLWGWLLWTRPYFRASQYTSPQKDVFFDDEMVPSGGPIIGAELVDGDWKHAPILGMTTLVSFSGLRLNAFATRGVVMGEEERKILRGHLEKRNLVNNSLPFRRELLPRLAEGDSVNNYNSMIGLLDRYFIADGAAIPNMKRRFCDDFVKLLKVKGQPPLLVHLDHSKIATFAAQCLYYRSNQLDGARRQFILLGTHADMSSSKSFFTSDSLEKKYNTDAITLSYLLNHPLLAHWYSTNMDIVHAKTSGIPIGDTPFHVVGRSLSTKNVHLFDHMNGNLAGPMLEGLDLTALFSHVGHPVKQWKRRAMWLEDALGLFTDRLSNYPVDWVPLSSLPARVTRVVVVLMPLEAGKGKSRPSLTSEVLVFRESGEGVTEASQSVALLPFTAALYHRLQQRGFGSPSRESKVLVAFKPLPAQKTIMNYLSTHTEFAVVLSRKGDEQEKKALFEAATKMAFVMCPPGYGYDTPLVWEALSLGAIPIVMDPKIAFMDTYPDDTFQRMEAYSGLANPSAFLEVYKDLPVVVVKDVSEITLESLERWRSEIYAKMQRGEYKLEKLFSQTWLDEIHRHSRGMIF